MPFPPPHFLLHPGPFSNAPHLFQQNCVKCTIRHQKCLFDANNQSCCNRCIKFGLLCIFKLSSQGRCNDLSALMTMMVAAASMAVTASFTATSTNTVVTTMMTMDMMVALSPMAATMTITADTMAVDIHPVPSLAITPATTAPTMHSTVAIMAPNSVTLVVEEEPELRCDYANKSVQYHHHFDGDSCHGCTDHVSAHGKSLPFICPLYTMPPPWVHVFSKSRQPSSLRTEAASIAYMEDSFHQKALHHHNWHHR
jgi:hypothetical protein